MVKKGDLLIFCDRNDAVSEISVEGEIQELPRDCEFNQSSVVESSGFVLAASNMHIDFTRT